MFPDIVKGGFVVGGQFGDGALLKKGKSVGLLPFGCGLLRPAGRRPSLRLRAVLDDELRARSISTIVTAGRSASARAHRARQGCRRARSRTTTAKDDIHAVFFDQKGLMVGIGIQGSKISRSSRSPRARLFRYDAWATCRRAGRARHGCEIAGPGRAHPSDARDDARSVGKPGTLLALLSLLALAGCESFGRGVTEAVLKGTGGQTEDTRNCEVEGRPFPGIAPYLAAQDKLAPFGEHGGRPARGQGALRARDRHARAGRRHHAAADPGQVAGARRPGPAPQADRDHQPELSETEPGRDQRHPADRRRSTGRICCSTS